METPVSHIIHLLDEGELTCFVVPQLFSKEECEALLDDNVKASFLKASTHYPTYYRNNDRLVIDSDPLAEQLFGKVKKHLPAKLPGGLTLHGINERFRYCRYAPGQRFSRHLDGIHHRSEKVQSRLTFLLYLNSANEFTGGRTLFYRSRTDENVWASWTPSQGDLIIFDHNIWHEGEELLKGEKFILRSDVLYEVNEISNKANDPYTGHLGYVWKLLSFNEDLLLSAGRDTSIKVWNNEGECVQELRGHWSSVLCMEKMNDSCFISGSRDQGIKVWLYSRKGFIHLRDINGHKGVVLSLCRLQGDLFAAGSAENVVKIFSLDEKLHRVLEGHADWVWSVVKIDDNTIASSSEDGTIRIWNFLTGECLQVIEEGCPVHTLAWDAGANVLISGNYKGELTLRDASDWKIKGKIKAHDGIIRTILVIDEKLVASGGEDNKIRIWNRQAGECIAEHGHANFVQTLVRRNNKLVSGAYDGEIKTWKLSIEK